MGEQQVALVTGASGFCGQHLALHLRDAGYRVVEFDRTALSVTVTDQYTGDITHPATMSHVVTAVRPDCVFHLAALAGVGRSYTELHYVNAYGSLLLLETLRKEQMSPRTLFTTSSGIYGSVPPNELPIREDTLLRPQTAYALSKAAQDLAAYQQFAAHNLPIIRMRPFNIIGPGQGSQFVASAFAKQLAEIELGRREPVIEVGNLDTQRDFVDVRDVAVAYRLAMERGKPGQVYNVCSGHARSIRSLLDILLTNCQVEDVEVRRVPALMQAADVPIQVGSFEKLHRQTGWQPEIPFDQTLRDLLDYWRRRTQEAA
jgi:GDP-4-dehydro-6-deoxy-D-mannose reductase